MAQLALATEAATQLHLKLDSIGKVPFGSVTEVPPSPEEQKIIQELKEQTTSTINSITEAISNALAQRQATLNTNKPTVELETRSIDTNPVLALKTQSENLSALSTSSEAMSASIREVVPDFDTILGLSGLSNFSATLNSVPAVGIVGNTIMYALTALKGDQSGIETTWSTFDTLPATPQSGQSTCLFSYNGAFYVSIGRALYRWQNRNLLDPNILQAATNDWSKMFTHPAQQVGGSGADIFPEADTRSILHYANLDSNAQMANSSIVRLGHDFSLSYFGGDITLAMSFTRLTFSPPTTNPGQAAPQLQKAAYWNGKIWGFDSAMILYSLSPNFQTNTYTIMSTEQLADTIVDFTAVDTGLVALRNDGTLWKRTITPPPASSPNDPSTISWQAYMNGNGITSLGAADPGMVLDLRTVSSYLRTNYINTQTSLIPTINSILAFCDSQTFYLNEMSTLADQYALAGDDEVRQLFATEAGTTAFNHLRAQSIIQSRNMNTAQSTIVYMTRQTSLIDGSLATQLEAISEKLIALNATLASDQKTFDDSSVGIWCSIAGALSGIGLAIAGFFAGPFAPLVWLGAGVLIVGGLVGVGIASHSRAQAAAAIQIDQANIQHVTQQQTQLTHIRAAFADLTADYSGLNEFWGTMMTDVGKINSNNEEFKELGTYILTDKPAITASLADVDHIRTNLNTYLQVLYSQGIIPPSEHTLMARLPNSTQTMDHEDLLAHIDVQDVPDYEKVYLKQHAATEMINAANKCYQKKDVKGYLAIMQRAVDFSKISQHVLIAL